MRAHHKRFGAYFDFEFSDAAHLAPRGTLPVLFCPGKALR
jgi:hypothetical protein